MMQGVVPKFGQARPSILWPGPALGAHTDAVLSDVLGLDAEEIDRLRKQGAI
jgi:crotonobetainyl-CoA:carnitine CoA-transferase CaiB-like acyl-CoA transferase